MTILDRYMVKEFTVFFLAVITGFVVLMTGNTAFIMSEFILGKQIPFWIISQILLLRAPAMIVLGLPVATIFGVFLSMGRLAKDSELIAMRTSGIPFQRIILPILGMAAVVSIGSFWLNESVVPEANHVSQNYIRQFWLTEVMEKAQAKVFFKIPGDTVLYTENYDSEAKAMGGVYVFELHQPGGYPKVTIAETGKMGEKDLVLTEGTSFEFKASGAIDRIASFGKFTSDVSREIHQLFGETRTPQEMSGPQLKNWLEDSRQNRLGAAQYETDYYFKFSIPVANLAFAMVGLLFIISNPRKENFYGILLGLVLIMVYWVLMTLARAAGQNGKIEPWLAAWAPNIVYLIVGLPALLLARR